jgi:predicted SnoaL-like aldol condensation-catalyzing enzyme
MECGIENKKRFIQIIGTSIENKEQMIKLWNGIYNDGKPDFSKALYYYDDDLYFHDPIQEFRGIDKFKEMTDRLVARCPDLKIKVINCVKEGNIYFIEWEMSMSFKNTPNTTLFGTSRLTMSEQGKICEQRDYYDLWGDIFDNIPKFGWNKRYRKFMKKKFG